jgi:hypothetical protein
LRRKAMSAQLAQPVQPVQQALERLERPALLDRWAQLESRAQPDRLVLLVQPGLLAQLVLELPEQLALSVQPARPVLLAQLEPRARGLTGARSGTLIPLTSRTILFRMLVLRGWRWSTTLAPNLGQNLRSSFGIRLRRKAMSARLDRPALPAQLDQRAQLAL